MKVKAPQVQKTRIDCADGVAVYVWYEKAPWAGDTWIIQVDVVIKESDCRAHARVETNQQPTALSLGKVAADVYMAWRDGR